MTLIFRTTYRADFRSKFSAYPVFEVRLYLNAMTHTTMRSL
jgi:hypothetical protein